MPAAGRALSVAGVPSSRIALARIALEAALAVPEVVGGDAGSHGLRVTADPDAGLLRGVSVVAERDGRYSVDLRLVARMTPLLALGDAVRRRVFASARRAQLEGDLAVVNVEFARLLAEEEDQPAALTRPTDAGASVPSQSAVVDSPIAGGRDEDVGR